MCLYGRICRLGFGLIQELCLEGVGKCEMETKSCEEEDEEESLADYLEGIDYKQF